MVLGIYSLYFIFTSKFLFLFIKDYLKIVKEVIKGREGWRGGREVEEREGGRRVGPERKETRKAGAMKSDLVSDPYSNN